MILENNKKKLSDMLLIIKVSMIIFTVIIVYMHLSEYWMNTKVEVVGKINIFTAMFFLLITIVVYMLCILMSPKLEMYHNVFKLKWLIENILCILFISVYFFITYIIEHNSIWIQIRYDNFIIFINSHTQYRFIVCTYKRWNKHEISTRYNNDRDIYSNRMDFWILCRFGI